MTTCSPHLSVVVPAFNEASRISAPLEAMGAYFARQPYTSEIIVVDDGSRDDTSEVVRRVAAKLTTPLSLHRYEDNRGKGHALKVGFAAARGQRILFTDVDLSTPIEECERLLATLDGSCEIAIGSRKMAGAHIAVHQPWYRERMGRVFTWITRQLIADVSDVTCGFKAFEGPAGRDVFARSRVADWSFDAELFMIASLRGYRVVEIPVTWHDTAGTKVRLLRAAVYALVGLVRIRLYAVRGAYARPMPIGQVVTVWSSIRTPEAATAVPREQSIPG